MGDAIGSLFLLCLLALGLAAFGFWLWMLIHALTRQAAGSEKLVWVFVIVMLPVIGSLIYFFVRVVGGTPRESARD